MGIKFIEPATIERACKEKEIRISGPPLGRPSAHVSPEKKKQANEDERIRSSIEGKFGQGKRRFSLSLVMTKLENTSRTSIAISFLVMNLAAGLRQLLSLFLGLFSLRTTQMSRFITSSYVRASVRQLKLNDRRGIESALDR